MIPYRALPFALILLSLNVAAQDFLPLERWKSAVLAGDDAGLRALYSSNPPAEIQNQKKLPISLSDEFQFWEGLKRDGLLALKIEIAKIQPGPMEASQAVSFETELKLKTPSGIKTEYVVQTQIWHTGANPQIVAAMRGDVRRLKQPLKLSPIYDAQADARQEIKAALARAGHEHKNVILDFGGNWCYDCHVLDLAFHHPEIEPVLRANYVLVHVDVGEYTKNLDLAKQYEVPLEKGVPALAVVAPGGKLLYTQRGGEFEKARSLAPEDVMAFLQKWKPAAR